MRKSHHRQALTLAAIGALVASAVWAQSTRPTESAAVEEVTVTAQRREERLQDVPISVSAVTAASAKARGITDTEALQNAVPGLTFTKGAAYALPVVRGVGTNTVSQGNENSVAVYVDGVIQVTPSSSIFSLNNIERVEVLKGPQGTLFGRNATGGVINVITRMPDSHPALELGVTAANYETYEGNVYATTGIGERLATDLAVYVRDQNKGWGHNLFTGDEVFKGYEASARNKWRWIPSDTTEVVVSGSFSELKDDGMSLHPAPGDVGADGVTTFRGMYNVSMDNSRIGGRSYAWRRTWSGTAHIRQELGWAKLISITGYSDVAVERPTDSDWTPLTILHAFVDQHDDGFTQELQLQSSDGSRIKWIAGLYYLDGVSEFRPPRGIQIMGAAAAGLDFIRILGRQVGRSSAGFAQGTATILPDTRLTLGGRYTSDKRDVAGHFAFPNGPAPSSSQSATFDKFTYRVSLDHTFVKDVMGYVSYSTGFKAGLFNLTNVAGDAVKPETIKATEVGVKSQLLDRKLQLNGSVFRYDYKDIQAEVIRSNAGGVLQLINAANSRIKGVDAELVAVPFAGFTLQAGLSYLDAKYLDFPGAVTYVRNPVGGRLEVGSDASGKRMIKAPEWQWNIGGQYSVPVARGTLNLAANYAHQSEFFWDFSNDFREPARDMLAASVGWAPSGGRWDVRLWGRNLAGEKITSFGLPSVWGFQQSPGAPRTFGITFETGFR
jgi:iron complex outermembrane recepter protein